MVEPEQGNKPDKITNIHVHAYAYAVSTHSMPSPAIFLRDRYRTRRPSFCLLPANVVTFKHATNANNQLAVNFAMKGCPFQVKATVLIVSLASTGLRLDLGATSTYFAVTPTPASPRSPAVEFQMN